jgi:hypothetical protein
VNKADTGPRESRAHDFYSLGIRDIFAERAKTAKGKNRRAKLSTHRWRGPGCCAMRHGAQARLDATGQKQTEGGARPA